MARKISKQSKRAPTPPTGAHRSKEKPQPTPCQAAAKSHAKTFPIVGVGASAGGLEAFTTLLNHLPPDSGMAFVLIQHLDWRRESQLAELLSRSTPMMVSEVKEDTPLAPDHVYVIAPAVCLRLSDGLLKADPRAAGQNLPIDHLFRSMAEERGSDAIGVVLSGTASDGTLGLKAIRAQGGITFAQEPSTAKFDGMPRSAISAGVADFILSPEEIGKRLVRIAQHPYVAPKSEHAGETTAETVHELSRLYEMLRATTGLDFSRYKDNTIRRRIHRRMVLRASERLRDYVAYMEANPAEVRLLADDLLIKVTSFFRDPEAFAGLSAKVFPEILKSRTGDESIRIWVPGCATGEEPYSIAICLTEFLEQAGVNVRFQIFATDVSEAAIEKARAGTYPLSALEGVSPERLKRFFVKSNGSYQIHRSIRETCIFATQNVGKDPPFHRVDLISCCNVLIYFGPVLQRKALSVFHYALKPAGFLMLGASEGVSSLAGAFAPADKKLKLFMKRPGTEALPSPLPPGEADSEGASVGELPAVPVRPALDVQRIAERMLLSQYAPAGVIIDDAMNVVHVRGDTGRYLQVATGEPTYQLLKMVREGLVVSLRTAIMEAKKKKVPTTQLARVKQDGHFRDVQLKVIPLNGAIRQDAAYFMVLFEEATSADKAVLAVASTKPASDKPVKTASPRSIRENTRLKRELAGTREYLQSIIEEQEASSEELKSANEEAQAVNEELETAKEELQSANEELNTVNDELKARNTALTDVNSDLQNVLSGIDVPLVMVGRDLAIRRFTQSMEPMLNLIDTDIGRPIADLKPNLDLPDLPGLLRSTIDGETHEAREIQGPDGRWYSLRPLPYKTPDGKINGALLVMLDIDAVKHGRDLAEAIIQTVRQPLLILTTDFRIRRANQAFFQTFKVSRVETEHRLLQNLASGQWNIPALQEALERIVSGSPGFEDFVVEHCFETIGQRTLAFSCREILQPEPQGRTLLLAIDDITARRHAEETETELARVTRTLTVGELTASIAHEVNQPLAGVVTNAETCLRWLGANPPNLAEAQQSLNLIVRDGNRASGIIRRIREFLKKETVHTDSLDINEVIEEAAGLARPGLTKDQISLRMELSAGLPPVRGDRIQLQQVILNLINNAREAMASVPAESRDLLVRSERSRESILVTVRDTGVGVAPPQTNRMFDAFYTTKPTGMGMGLSISRSIVEGHGGQIWAASNEHEGLTVGFTLPIESERPS